MRIWNLTEIDEPTQLRTLTVLPTVGDTKVDLHALRRWNDSIVVKWGSYVVEVATRFARNLSGQATAKVRPRLVRTASIRFMTNDLVGAKPAGEAVLCLALTNNDSYLMSASGGKVSLFNTMTFGTLATFMAPPPATTCIAYHHQDNNVIAVSMEDSTLKIYNVRIDEVNAKLKGHTKRITGLAFSRVLNILVSSGADSQIIIWNCDGWRKQKSTFLRIPDGRTPAAMSDILVQFHHDQKQFLAVNETQLAIYDATEPESLKQWVVGESSAPISNATFSCDSQLVYSCFVDGTMRIFSGINLQLQCQINASAYVPANIGSDTIYPRTIAAHPRAPNQFAVGLTTGSFLIFEPLESAGGWGVPPPLQNGSAHDISPQNSSTSFRLTAG